MDSPLLRDIRTFLAETGMSEGRFGLKACGNGRLVEQLEGRPFKVNGVTKIRNRPGRVWPETEAKVRAFMMYERQKRREHAA